MIRILEWDSIFWDMKIADCIYENTMEIKAYLDKNNIDMIQTQININKLDNIRELENLKFRFIDLNITYEINLAQCDTVTSNYCIADNSNINDIENIASKVFSHSRYNILNIKKTKEFYKLWAKKAILGELDDVCLIEKDKNDKIKGFVTLKIINSESAKIGLIGVDQVYQRHSVGTILVKQVQNFLLSKNIKKLFVSTQGSNIDAQNFYTKNGFKIYDISVWMYFIT